MATYLIDALIVLITKAYIEYVTTEATNLKLAITNEIAFLLSRKSPLIVSVSGGKDSDAQALLLNKLLTQINYEGERLLIHADLGRIEHAESIQQVRALAKFINWKLIIVRREKGDLLDRYEQRWHDNCVRYANLSCVTLISPWPQPQSPFCRADAKISPIVQKAVQLFPGQPIINCVGLRAEESSKRASNPVSQRNPKLDRAAGTTGYNWNPILNLKIEDVWLVHKETGFPRHPQYDRGNERISCAYCFLGSLNDLQNAAEVPTNYDSYRILSTLELRSGFSYQQSRWLADIKPELLLTPLLLSAAKATAAKRKSVEQQIPIEMRFSNDGGRHGWPSRQPTLAECELLARARYDMKTLMGDEIRATTGFEVKYTTAQEVYDRYAELLAEKREKDSRKRERAVKTKTYTRYDICNQITQATAITGAPA